MTPAQMAAEAATDPTVLFLVAMAGFVAFVVINEARMLWYQSRSSRRQLRRVK